MYCRYCGEQIDDNEVYCPHCGELVWEPGLDEAHAAGITKSSGRSHKAVAIIVVIAILLLAAGSCGIVVYTNLSSSHYTPISSVTGVLSVAAVPEGAEIYVDLVDYGTSPQVITVSAGTTHTLLVSAEGYTTYEQTFSVEPNEVLTVSPVLSYTSSDDMYTPVYQWKYNGLSFALPLALSKEMYTYYQNLGHLTNNPTKYATDSYNRELAAGIAAKLTQEANARNLDAYDRLMLAATFVQNIPYKTDEESKGTEEYARYPIETLVDGVADCEDSAVLLAAILKEMGYDVVIVKFEGHVALGVALDGITISGGSLQKDGVKYYYLETVSPGWELGEIADKYLGKSVKIYPVN